MSITGFNKLLPGLILSSGKAEYEKLNKDDVRKYVGAVWSVKYVLDNGPETSRSRRTTAALHFATGPLSGTKCKMSRMTLVTKSPLTGTVTDSHIGGWTAAKLKWARLDGILFWGKIRRSMPMPRAR